MSKMKWFWLGMAAFTVAYLALRVFWITGDPGIAAAWEYGYNATDEGYYLVGGKEKLLWGFFVDLSRTEAFTYGFSAGTHWLSYIAHLVFGLSTWTWRIPFLIISFVAWISMFAYLAKKSGVVHAALLCLASSSIPMIVAYERTASNDVLIGSLAAIAYVVAAGKGRWRIFAAAVIVALTVLVKPSVWLLIPVVAAGILQCQKFRRQWFDVALYVVSAVLCVYLCRLAVALSVTPEAQSAGVSIWEVVRRTTTHYPLPNIFNFASHFKGLSAFPRDPSYAMLGVMSIFMVVLPALMATRHIAALRFNGNTLLYLSVAAYVAAINVMNTLYTHYFIPALMFMPIVIDSAMAELDSEFIADKFKWQKTVVILSAVVAAAGVGLLFVYTYLPTPEVAQYCYSLIYNFPTNNVWTVTAPALTVFVLVVVAALGVLRGFRLSVRYGFFWALAAFAAASVVFAAMPAISMAPYLKRTVSVCFAPMSLSLVIASILLVSVFGMAESIPWRRCFAPFVLIAVVIGYVISPNWRSAACELVQPPTHRHAECAKELRRLLPDDAVVIGERSNQMLMSLPIRTATTFAANSDGTKTAEDILKVNPKANLYLLADSQHSYNLQNFSKKKDRFELRPLVQFKMPSFAAGKPADVYLCKIIVKDVGK